MFVYRITNRLNGKVYIGQTIRPIQKRFERHIQDAISDTIDTHFARAIRKHGAENFRMDLIDIAWNQLDLNRREQRWIRIYGSTDPKRGYNETDAIYKCGGNTYRGKSAEEMKAVRKKISQSKQGSRNPNARRVKCKNVVSGEEIMFDTGRACQEYFGEKTHRFVTTRVTGKTRGLYKGEWAIAYADAAYSFDREVHKTGCKLQVRDLENGKKTALESINQLCRCFSKNKSNIQTLIKRNPNGFVIDDRYEITTLN